MENKVNVKQMLCLILEWIKVVFWKVINFNIFSGYLVVFDQSWVFNKLLVMQNKSFLYNVSV